ncbi:hypothetical protein [Alkalicoccobacillus gibsonii]|uniref:hypothetical protein n=1 Tax=Alkalicoccobacillus gibsonii TaxID=79881 RepID=UPI00351757F2
MDEEVYLKFGKYHGLKGTVIGHREKNGEPAYLLRVEVSPFTADIITKKQKNCVRMLRVNK